MKMVRRVLGDIDLDPFSCSGANVVVGAGRFFTKHDRPFKRAWRATTAYIHPPSGLRLLNQLPNKFFAEWDRCKIKRAIILLDTASRGICYGALIARANAVCLTNAPIDFLTPNAAIVTTGTRHAFLYFGRNTKRFREVFASLGTVSVTKQKMPKPPQTKKLRRRQPARGSK